MPDKLVDLAANAEYGEIVLGAILALLAFLFKRAIHAQDEKIRQNSEEIEQLRLETDGKINQVAESVKTLTNEVSTQSIKTAENFGEVKKQLGEIIGMMRVLTEK